MNQVGRAAFRPLDPEVREDPYRIYARLRREQPIAWSTTPASGFLGFWFVSRYDDVAAGLKDNRFGRELRSEEHTSELQSLMRISYAVFCLKKKKKTRN